MSQSHGGASKGPGGPRKPDQQNILIRDLTRANAPDHPVVAHLQRQVANAFVLYMNYKHYHWQVYGPLFRDLHLLFDELAHDVRKTIDPIAERVRMIGQDPIGGPREVMDGASVRAAARGQSVKDMILEADANLLIVIKEMREAARAAEAADDPGSVDLFSRMVQVHEKHEWWLRDVLEKSDGLSGPGPGEGA